jgi:hypothetical protein
MRKTLEKGKEKNAQNDKKKKNQKRRKECHAAQGETDLTLKGSPSERSAKISH